MGQAPLGLLSKPIRVLADGAYAKAKFLNPANSLGMTVISRLRCDASLRSLPPPAPAASWRLGRNQPPISTYPLIRQVRSGAAPYDERIRYELWTGHRPR